MDKKECVIEAIPETYIKKGYIDIADNVAFRLIKDACNCFGHTYLGYQRGGAPHPYDDDTLLWFPKLFPNGVWINTISDDEVTITEKNEDDKEDEVHISKIVNGEIHKRIVFAKDNFRGSLYRFRGLYELNLKESNLEIGLVWKRTATRVKTYPQKKC